MAMLTEKCTMFRLKFQRFAQVRTRKIPKFEILDTDGDSVLTYTNARLAPMSEQWRDLGLLLDTPVELKELRRPTSGEFSLSQAITMQQLADAYLAMEREEGWTAITRILIRLKICFQIYQEL